MPVDWNYLSAQAVAYFFQYVLWVTVYIVRFLDLRIGVLDKSVSSRPTRIFRIPSSKDSRRKIVVDVYEPSNNLTRSGPLPVHVNFHGSGFVLPCHGSDAELCAHWAAQIGCVVLDSDYAKGPKYPYPAAIDDALDVFAYVTSRPDLFDLSKITVGGFSAGANIAIQSALRLAGEEFPVKAIVAWYPPTNMTREGTEKRATNSFRKWLYRSFRLCYLPAGIERADPRVSPVFADSTLFPPITLIVGEDDKLLADSVELADKLTADGIDCILHTIPKANHAWERFVKRGSPLWEARDKALALTENRLREVYDT